MLKFIRTLVVASTAALPLAIASLPAQAGTATTTFQVTATVVNSCVINSASTLAFGNYDVNAVAAITGTSTINVNCTKGDAYTIALNYGANGGSASNRIMVSGTNNLNYNLFTDSGYTKVWNSSCGAGNNCDGGTGAGPGAGNQQSYTVYGQIAAGQNVPAGSYADTITITVNF
jgi:spore coat protein U domain-containing protein, fimbrial subunit CupE1/2/3/6